MCSVFDVTTLDIGSHFGSEIDMTEIIRRLIASVLICRIAVFVLIKFLLDFILTQLMFNVHRI